MRDSNNIKELAKLNPDFIGLIFYPKSKRFVEEENANHILSSIPDEIKKVGVFVNEVQEEVVRKVSLFKLTLVQLHGNESAAYCASFKKHGIPIIKAFGVNEEFNFESVEAYEGKCDYFLFDTKTSQHGGSGKKYNWDLLNNYMGNTPFFLSGGIEGKDAKQILALSHPALHAVDVNSGFETAPGLKNIDQLNSFCNEIKILPG